MYSFQQSLFQTWNVESKPMRFEEQGVRVNWHEVFLPNPEHLREDVGSGRTINGRIQQSNVMIALPAGKSSGAVRMWLLDSPPVGVPTTERLILSNIGVLQRLPKEMFEAFTDFPGEPQDVSMELFAHPVVPAGIMFNSGDPRTGGFYLVFQSDCVDPIEVTVRIRMEVNVNNV
jgi:hypothetical protein